ncbi:MAG: energy-coupling factor ABC transporter permease [Pirellulaceae bacterium]
MHLGNGAITPECVALTVSAASAGLGLCAWSVRRTLTRSVSEGSDADRPSLTRRVSMAVGLGAFIFAAQAVNVPILPGISAHLVGGVLLAWALGPALGSLTMALVLALQALLLGDGGTLALGANILNMSLIPAALVAIAQRANWLTSGQAQVAPRQIGLIAALSAAAVVIAAGLIAVEVSLFRASSELAGWTAFAQQMLSVHLLIGMAEGATTGLIVATLAWLASPAKSLSLRPAFVTAALAILTALAIPFSSQLPDGYEYAAERSGQANWLK